MPANFPSGVDSRRLNMSFHSAEAELLHGGTDPEGVDVTLRLEIRLIGDIHDVGRPGARHDIALVIGNTDREQQVRRQQAICLECVQFVVLPRGRVLILDELQGLIDFTQCAQNLRLIGFCQLMAGDGGSSFGSGAFHSDEV